MSSTHGHDPDDSGSTPEERRAFDELFSLLYEELRGLASFIRRNEANQTLNSTALVNEAWIKLRGAPHVARFSRSHFKWIAGRAMRRLLVDTARNRRAGKRGDGAIFVTLGDASDAALTSDKQILALDDALQQLARIDPRQARVIECRFFGGLDLTETAAALGVSETTVQRDWRLARAWLENEMHPEQ